MDSKIRRMGTERSKPPLHNFTMPANLRWGGQRFLRCMKVNSNGQSLDRRPESDDDDGIAAMREKVMIDLQTAADKMKDAIFKEGELRASPPPISMSMPTQPAPTVSWNLRTRRAACRIGNDGGGSGKDLKVDVAGPSSIAVAVDKSPRLRSGGGGAEKKERAKFTVALSKKEIEEDFLAIVGHRPPRRPKKRPRNVQKLLDTLFPGLWSSEVTPDMYKVTEPAP